MKKEFNAERVYANWFTGKLLASNGKQIHYVHSGYNSFYETELEFNIKKGDLIEYREYNNSKSYKSIYTENQDSLVNFIYSNINWDSIPNLSNKSERVYIRIQSGENRKPDSIEIVKKSDIEILNKEAIRVTSLLPEWDVYYKRGEIHKIKWTIPLIFSESRRRKYAR